MKIKRSSITFNNVICHTRRCSVYEWHHAAREMRNAIVKNGVYGTGPIIYQVSNLNAEKKQADYSFYAPVNVPVEIEGHSLYRFEKTLSFPDGLILRHADLDESIDESYDILRACAEAHHLTLREPFFNIYLDVYGDGVIDIFAPIIEEKQHD